MSPANHLARSLLPLVVAAAAAHAQQRSGVVFLDRNANGARDPGERGVAGVAVSDQDTVVLTDGGGVYRMAGSRGHGLVFVSVPSGFRAVGPFWKTGDSASFGLTGVRAPTSFRFIHASDTHISEQSAQRTRMLRQRAAAAGAAFVLISGDLVRDALRVGEAEATGYYQLFARERAAFAQPVFTVPGNHEIFGIETDKSGVSPAHPLFGRTMYRHHFGPDYYSFNYGGVHFVGLNTVDIYGSSYHGAVDSLQLAWLEQDLAAIPLDMPVVTFNHIPFYTLAEQRNGIDTASVAPTLIRVRGRLQLRHTVANAADVLSILARRVHVLALGGHVHSVERIDFGWDGIPTRFRNAAAVVGPTSSAGRLFPSGYTIYTVRDGVIDDGVFVRLP